jgi:hypothetical protein
MAKLPLYAGRALLLSGNTGATPKTVNPAISTQRFTCHPCNRSARTKRTNPSRARPVKIVANLKPVSAIPVSLGYLVPRGCDG